MTLNRLKRIIEENCNDIDVYFGDYMATLYADEHSVSVLCYGTQMEFPNWESMQDLPLFGGVSLRDGAKTAKVCI